ncbi:MAG: hypothetical protein HYU77_09900 [Betaproteobacteria bacterium]|nr:hypothetical protein [Betaproteobacteria bacterium]
MKPVIGSVFARLLLIAGFGLALIHSVEVSVAWWRGELAAVGFWDGVAIAALPLLVAIWLRYFSIFAPGKGQCLLPEEKPKAPGCPRSRPPGP